MLAVLVSQAARGQTPAPQAAVALGAGAGHGIEEVIVTASKRSEKLQRVPMSVQVLDSKRLSQLQVHEFQDFLKFLPSVSAQTAGPNQTTINMRGVASGFEGNHSGPLPTVGTYLDELPITTIGGTLDVHLYDIARVEALPGPQGTLFGASSEAGTLRIITNPPTSARLQGGYDLEGNVVGHGGLGGIAEGFVNIPITDKVAIRLVAFDEHDAGYIDNIAGTRVFPTAQAIYGTAAATVNNSQFVRNDFNAADSFGGRATLRVDIDDVWSVTPTVVVQDQRYNGIFAYVPSNGDLNVQRFQPDTYHDRWLQSGVTVQGKIGDFDLTYAGGFFVRDLVTQSDYTDYSISYDGFGSGTYWRDAHNNILPRPLQEIDGKDHFTKESNELRLASPSTDRLRFIVGAFQEIQEHRIIQDYVIQGFGPQISVPGWPNTIWLTDQLRTDRDEAIFGELSYDILPNLTVTGGVRPYWYNNTLKGFFGFSEGYKAETGYGATQICHAGDSFEEAPCVRINRSVSGSGETHKINLTYKIDDLRLAYFTYSTGYRPGGLNRNGAYGPYNADTLTNYELGFKSSWLDQRLHFNVALYNEDWSNFQFSFLGLNSLTIVENAPQANIKGLEVGTDFRATDQLTFSGGATLTDNRLTQNFCGASTTTGVLIPTCSSADAKAPAGTALPYAPGFKGNMTARYTYRLFDLDAFTQGSVVYQTRSQVALQAADKIALGSMPSFASFDFSAGVSRNKLSLSLFAKNAFDERGQENRYSECTLGVCKTIYVLPIAPLTVGLRLSQRF